MTTIKLLFLYVFPFSLISHTSCQSTMCLPSLHCLLEVFSSIGYPCVIFIWSIMTLWFADFNVTFLIHIESVKTYNLLLDQPFSLFMDSSVLFPHPAISYPASSFSLFSVVQSVCPFIFLSIWSAFPFCLLALLFAILLFHFLYFLSSSLSASSTFVSICHYISLVSSPCYQLASLSSLVCCVVCLSCFNACLSANLFVFIPHSSVLFPHSSLCFFILSPHHPGTWVILTVEWSWAICTSRLHNFRVGLECWVRTWDPVVSKSL